MRKMILATAAVLGLGAGSVLAATNGNAQSQAPNAYRTAPGAVVPSGASDRSTDSVMSTANPWQGTESWDQWYKDHPLVGDD